MSAVAARRPTRATEQRPALRVVPRRRPRHSLRYLLLTVVLLGASVFAAVSLNALAASDAVLARALEDEVAQAQREHARLVAEVAALDTPSRIREVAEQQLGMVPAGSPRLLLLDRALPGDDLPDATASDDPLKPVLAAER